MRQCVQQTPERSLETDLIQLSMSRLYAEGRAAASFLNPAYAAACLKHLVSFAGRTGFPISFVNIRGDACLISMEAFRL